MSLYSVKKLMDETRRLAAQYHRATGQSLPVTMELARYDAVNILGLSVPGKTVRGIDAIGKQWRPNKRIQIKGRVIFEKHKSKQRIGQLDLQADWDLVLLVLLDENYTPFEIYQASKDVISDNINEDPKSKRSKRGIVSIVKFKAIGDLVWSIKDGTVAS